MMTHLQKAVKLLNREPIRVEVEHTPEKNKKPQALKMTPTINIIAPTKAPSFCLKPMP